MAKLIKIFNKAIIAAVIVSAISFFANIVPCSKAPVVAEPEYALGFCKLPNPWGEQLVGISEKFYTIASDPLAGLILQFLVVLIVVMIILSAFKRKQRKIIDLTRKS